MLNKRVLDYKQDVQVVCQKCKSSRVSTSILIPINYKRKHVTLAYESSTRNVDYVNNDNVC